MSDLNDKIDWDKVGGLVPAIVQDALTKQVLMLGYMNSDALSRTLTSRTVTFFSRTRQTLWTKGETSGNSLILKDIFLDCDRDTLLITVTPQGPVCHTGTPTCFEQDKPSPLAFIAELGELVRARNINRPEGSYTTRLFEQGRSRIAQKVGEEGVEVALAHMEDNPEKTANEAADLLFHTMVLLEHGGLHLGNVAEILKARHTAKK